MPASTEIEAQVVSRHFGGCKYVDVLTGQTGIADVTYTASSKLTYSLLNGKMI